MQRHMKLLPGQVGFECADDDIEISAKILARRHDWIPALDFKLRLFWPFSHIQAMANSAKSVATVTTSPKNSPSASSGDLHRFILQSEQVQHP
jgi:hypothetical protein